MPNVVCSRCTRDYPPSQMYDHIAENHPEAGLPPKSQHDCSRHPPHLVYKDCPVNVAHRFNDAIQYRRNGLVWVWHMFWPWDGPGCLSCGRRKWRHRL